MKIIMEPKVIAGAYIRPFLSSLQLQRLGAIALSSAIFVIDTASSIHIAIAVLYVAVILISVNIVSKKGVIRVSFCCIGLTLIAFLGGHGLNFHDGSFARFLVSLSAIGITSFLALKNKAVSDELQEQVRLLAQTHDAIIVRDMDHIITKWSPGAEKLYGWSRSQAVGQDFRTLLCPQLMTSWDQMMTCLLETGHWEGEVVERCRDGACVTVISRCSLSRGDDNVPKAILATHNDISDRKRAIEALQRSEAFLTGAQWLSQTGSIGLIIPSGEMYWSEEARRIFEFSADEQPMLTSVMNRTHPDDVDLVKMSIKDAFQKQPHIKTEYRLLMDDGRVKYVQMLAQLILDGEDDCEYVGALMDVTDAKMSEEALHRSEAQLAHVSRVATLGELAASIAHEVNQPLSAVTTNGTAGLRWLNREVPDLAEVRGAIERMVSETNRASEVIRRIRAMARKTAPQNVPLNIIEVIDESLALVDRELKRNKVVLDLSYDSDAAKVDGDRVQLQQVIINLLMNGMQAMTNAKTKKRTLCLSLQYSEIDEVLVDIKDSGPGITSDQMPNLFEAFFTTKSEGMGMGLSICRSIIEAHGGRIWATSEKGLGATFHLALPLSKKEHV
ncbi:PAS domain S-box-containing protein [Pseudomonas helmanticensis]|uniref:PAS domain S-box-containing protein n=1 Tax=Pseudomonas helmanticensis TaxID=1471381 RepID=A0ACD2UDD4_9PSED|nr:ATP-binding protein [Pseudomonas helmanticensis]SMQ30380.1 PAS domain S-box-containing protein [Pseudomonas helmanticensis]